jgi:hypothetical protein
MESEDVRHVLDDDVAGSKLANDSSELGPQRSLRVSEASPLPRRRGSLAWEAAGDAVDGLEVVGADVSDVVVNRAPWPSSGEQGAAVGLTLDEPCVLVAGLVESGVE